MSKRHAFPLILLAFAMPLAACSPSGSGNISATDNAATLDVTNDSAGADDIGAPENEALVNDLVAENETAAVNGSGAN